MSDYTPAHWVDNAAPAIDAAQLNRMDGGIKRALDSVEELQGADSQLSRDIAAAKSEALTAAGQAAKAAGDANTAAGKAAAAAGTAAAAAGTAQSTANKAVNDASTALAKARSNESRITTLENTSEVNTYLDGKKLGTALIQAGTTNITSNANILVFPQPFKSTPVIIATYASTDGVDRYVYVSNQTPTQCLIGIYKAGTVAKGPVAWVAIGEVA